MNIHIPTKYFWFAFIFSFAWLYLPNLHAQTDGTVEEDENPGRIINLKLYGWPFSGAIYDDTKIPNLPPLYYPSGTAEGPKENMARVHRNRSTGPFPYLTFDDSVVFYIKKEVTNPETGEITYKRIPQIRVQIPPKWDNALLVVFPDAVDKGLYRTLPMDASTGQTPEGMVRIVNGTQDTLGIMAGGEMKVIPPSESVLFKPELRSGSNRFPIKMARKDGNEWKAIYTSNKKMNPDKANLMAVYPAGGRRVQIMNFGEIR